MNSFNPPGKGPVLPPTLPKAAFAGLSEVSKVDWAGIDRKTRGEQKRSFIAGLSKELKNIFPD